MGTFFGSERQERNTPYDAPRAIVGSAERLNLSRSAEERVDKRATSEWQLAAWRFFDQIGELHFAFSLIGQVVSRVRLYPAIVVDPERPPVDLKSFLESMDDKGGLDNSRIVADKAMALTKELTEKTPGRASGMLRSLAMNLSVPGEVYLAHDEKEDKWLVLSSEEITTSGSKYKIKRSRTASQSTSKKDRELDKQAFVARIWRSHPRWGDEPDSSMLGVLDQCEQLVLLDQVMRAMSRRAMNAGLVYLPDGLTAFEASDDAETIAESIARSALEAVERETAIATVTPKVITGPPELGDSIKRIVLADPINEKISESADRLLERILQGVDIPKDLVKGLADVKYSNAIVIDENMFRAHIEPLVLLIVDSLTTVYLRPLLKKGLSGPQAEFAENIIMWADTSEIVTRPDHSSAANEGYDKKLISGEAWRRTRGFDETDAPEPDELLQRLLIDRGPIPQDMAAALLERLDPEFFKKQRGAAQDEAGFPDDIRELLSDEGPVPTEPGATPAEDSEIPAGGTPAPVPVR